MHVIVLVPGDYYVISLKEYYQNVFAARAAFGFDVAVLAVCRKRRRRRGVVPGKAARIFLNQF